MSEFYDIKFGSLIEVGRPSKIILHKQSIKTLTNVAIQNVLIGFLCKTVLNCRPTTIKL